MGAGKGRVVSVGVSKTRIGELQSTLSGSKELQEADANSTAKMEKDFVKYTYTLRDSVEPMSVKQFRESLEDLGLQYLDDFEATARLGSRASSTEGIRSKDYEQFVDMRYSSPDELRGLRLVSNTMTRVMDTYMYSPMGKLPLDLYNIGFINPDSSSTSYFACSTRAVVWEKNNVNFKVISLKSSMDNNIGTIAFSSDIVTKHKQLENFVSIREHGWHVGSDSLIATVAHELGHAVLNNIGYTNPSRLREYAKKTAGVKLEAVSTYGASSSSENFAEAFSAYVQGYVTLKKGKECYKEFKSLMKDMGLSTLFGCASSEKVYTASSVKS